MSYKKNNALKLILVGSVFVILMVSPAIIKPDENPQNLSDEYGFTLVEVTEEIGISFKHESPVLDEQIHHILPQIASVGASASISDFNND